jgi:hypothetical protein
MTAWTVLGIETFSKGLFNTARLSLRRTVSSSTSAWLANGRTRESRAEECRKGTDHDQHLMDDDEVPNDGGSEESIYAIEVHYIIKKKENIFGTYNIDTSIQ